MEFRVLGPLEVRVDDRPLPLGGTRPRVVLAALLLGRNTVVPVDRLIAAVWGEDPPGTPTAQIQAAVSALRKTLGADRIVTRNPGYLIRIERGELDLDEFDQEVAGARRALDEGDVARAAAGLAAALTWWRDDALVDLAELPVRTAAVAVDERRWTVWEERIEADLALRRHAELVPELSALVSKRPLRDRLWSQLMRAQYRSGRRADALETYRQARATMRDELGLEPAAELAALHAAILADDPALDPDELALGSAEWVRPPCPYRALQAYRQDDAATFFGRRAEIAAVVARAAADPVTVVGPSGSGKSSLVLAGVLPALRGATALVVRPSDEGRIDRALAAAAARVLGGRDDLAGRIVDDLGGVVAEVLAHTGGARLVVVVDQAEELLTQDDALVDRVVMALFAPVDRLTVLATLRADHLGEVLVRPALSTTLGGSGVYTLGAMGPDQLREVVAAPVADLAGVGFQPGLVDRILDDVGSEPGTLALLGLTLTLLWDEQVDGTMTHRAYDDLGRVPGAVATHAEGEWRRHNLAAEDAAVRRLFGRLVQVRSGDRVTRRVATRAELDEQAWRLAARLSATRLLVVTGDAAGARVELAHEALTTHWPRLRGWIADDLDFHLWRTALRADLERWQLAGRDDALLARGGVLADARERLRTRAVELVPDEIDYVRRSAQLHRSTGRRSRVLRSGLAAAAVLVLVLGVVLAVTRDRTDTATADAESRELAAAATDTTDPARAALLAIAAHDRAPTVEATTVLFRRYREFGRLETLVADRDLRQGFAAASADGRVVVSGRGGDEVLVWVRDPGRPARLLRTPSLWMRFALTADGSAVWVLAADGIGRLDTVTGETRTVVRAEWFGTPQIALSADGSRIAVAEKPDPAAGTHRVREWSTVDGRPTGTATYTDPRPNRLWPGPRPGSVVIEYVGRGAWAAEVVDLATGARTEVATGEGGAVAEDGSGLVRCTTAGGGVAVTGVRIADGTPVGRAVPLTGETGCPTDLAAALGGQRVVTDLGLADMRVIDLVTGTAPRVMAAGASQWVTTYIAGLTPDGSRLVLSGESSISVVDLSAPGTVVPVLRAAELLRDGRSLVGVSPDGALQAAPLVAGGPSASVPRPSPYLADDGAPAIRVSAAGVVADRTAPDRVTLRRLPSLASTGTVTLTGDRLDDMFFDVAGRLVTVAGQEVSWWDPVSGARVHRLVLDRRGPGVKVSPMPDPALIAVTVSDRPDLTVHDVDGGRVVGSLDLGTGIESADFQRSSDYVVVSRPASTEVWDLRTRQRMLGPLAAGEGATRVAGLLDRPGHVVALERGSDAWRFLTWDVDNPAPLVSLDLSGAGSPGAIARDGGLLALNDSGALAFNAVDGELSDVVPTDPATWRVELCRVLGGADLTAADRAAHPGITGGPVCGFPSVATSPR